MPGICSRCNRSVFKADEKCALGRIWHNFCFSCYKCRRLLESCKVYTKNGEIWCQTCHARAQGECPCHLDVPNNYTIERDYECLKATHRRRLNCEDVEFDCPAAEYCISQMDITSRRPCYQCDTTEFTSSGNGECGNKKDITPTYHHSSVFSSEESDYQYDDDKCPSTEDMGGCGQSNSARPSILKTSVDQRCSQASSDRDSEDCEPTCPRSKRTSGRSRSESPASNRSSCCCCKPCPFGGKECKEECDCPDPNIPVGVCALPSPTAITAWYSRQHKLKRVRHRCCDNVECDDSEDPCRLCCSADRGYVTKDACIDCCTDPVKEDNTGGCINDKGSRGPGLPCCSARAGEQEERFRILSETSMDVKKCGCRLESGYSNSGSCGSRDKKMSECSQEGRNPGRSDNDCGLQGCPKNNTDRGTGRTCQNEKGYRGNESSERDSGRSSCRPNNTDKGMSRSCQDDKGYRGSESSERDCGRPNCRPNNMDTGNSRSCQDDKGYRGSESSERDCGKPNCRPNNTDRGMSKSCQDEKGYGGSESSERDCGIPNCRQNNTDRGMSRSSQDDKCCMESKSSEQVCGISNAPQNNCSGGRTSRKGQDSGGCGNSDRKNKNKGGEEFTLESSPCSTKRDKNESRGSGKCPPKNRESSNNKCGKKSETCSNDRGSEKKECPGKKVSYQEEECNCCQDQKSSSSGDKCRFMGKDNKQLRANSQERNPCEECQNDFRGQRGSKMYNACEIRGSRIDGGCCGHSLGGGTMCRRCGRQEGVPCGDDAGLWSCLPYLLLLLLLLPEASGGQQYLGEPRRNIL